MAFRRWLVSELGDLSLASLRPRRGAFPNVDDVCGYPRIVEGFSMRLQARKREVRDYLVRTAERSIPHLGEAILKRGTGQD